MGAMEPPEYLFCLVLSNDPNWKWRNTWEGFIWLWTISHSQCVVLKDIYEQGQRGKAYVMGFVVVYKNLYKKNQICIYIYI